jgi:hypothetical protein
VRTWSKCNHGDFVRQRLAAMEIHIRMRRDVRAGLEGADFGHPNPFEYLPCLSAQFPEALPMGFMEICTSKIRILTFPPSPPVLVRAQALVCARTESGGTPI